MARKEKTIKRSELDALQREIYSLQEKLARMERVLRVKKAKLDLAEWNWTIIEDTSINDNIPL